MTTIRVAWLDIAKGMSILLVVAYHVTADASLHGFRVWRYTQISDFFSPIRMPLFFLVSGLLATSALALPWRRFLVKRVWLYAYLLTLWTAIGWLYYGYVYSDVKRPKAGTDPSQIFEELYRPTSSIWFLWALLLFFVIARLGNGRFRNVILGIALMLSLGTLGGLIVTDNFAQGRALSYAVFFLAGCYHRARLLALLQAGSWWRPLALAIVFVLTFPLNELIRPPFNALVLLGQSIAGVMLAVRVAMLLSNVAGIGRLFQYFGRQTLAIYVTHPLVIAAFCGALLAYAPYRLAGILIVPLGVIVALSLSLLVRALADAAHLDFLYVAPWVNQPDGEPRGSARPPARHAFGHGWMPSAWKLPGVDGDEASRSRTRVADTPSAPTVTSKPRTGQENL